MSHYTMPSCSAPRQAAGDFLTQTSTTENAAFELGRVLGQNNISDSDFNELIERTRGLFQPNNTGAVLRSKIIDAEMEYGKLGTLSLVSIRSLGHRLAISEDHFWIVSTIVTCLKGCTLHGIVQIMAPLLFPDLDHEKFNVVDYLPVMVVLWKVILDIVANISNASFKYECLPRPLSELCSHFMSPRNFHRVVNKIKQSSRCNVIKTDKFYANLTSWLLHHFHGSITISIAGKEIYSSRLCDCSRSLNMVIENLCECRYKMYRKRGSTLKERSHISKNCDALLATISRMPVAPPRSNRQMLYELSAMKRFSKKEFDQIVNISKEFWSWLLNSRVRSQGDALNCVFELHRASQESDDKTTRFRDMVTQSPKRWRDIPENLTGISRQRLGD